MFVPTLPRVFYAISSAAIKSSNAHVYPMARRLHLELLQVDPTAYQLLLDCIESNDINVCDQVPSGVESGGRKLVNPLGGGGHQVDGADRYVCASTRDRVVCDYLGDPSKAIETALFVSLDHTSIVRSVQTLFSWSSFSVTKQFQH